MKATLITVDYLKELFEENKMAVAIAQRSDKIQIQVPGDMIKAKNILQENGIDKSQYSVSCSVISLFT